MMRCETFRRALLVLVLAIIPFATQDSEAAPVGRLFGNVRDRGGKPIAGASIIVTGPGAVGVYDARTNANGTYQFMALPTQEILVVRAESPGKLPVVYSGVTVSEGSGTRRDFKLRGVDEHEVLILYDPRFKYHEVVLQGSRSTIKADIVTLKVTGRGVNESRRLSDMLAMRPNAVLAIGQQPTRLSRRAIKDTPVVYAMEPDPIRDDLTTVNLCGFTLNGGFDDQLDTLARMRPSARRLLTVFDPRILARDVRELRRLAHERGMTLEVRPARDVRQFAVALKELDPDEFDAYFYLVNPALYSAGDFDRVKRFTAKSDIVLIVPDPSLVDAGGTFSYAPGFREMGAHAGRLVNQILSGAVEPSDIGVRFPTVRALSINDSEAKRLGLTIPKNPDAPTAADSD